MRKILTNISLYLLVAIIALAAPLTSVYAKESRSLKKTFEASVGTKMEDTLIYEAQGALGDFNKTINGITLKACTLSSKYGLCLGGTPLGSGPVTFAGNLDDGNNINLVYDITVNVANEKKVVVQVYDINISDQIDDKLVYDSLGTITPSINDEKNGLTLYSGDYGGTYGIHLKGKATQGGTITFSGATVDNGNGGDRYDISYNVSVNVDKPSIELKQNFEASVGKRIKSTLVYESATTLSEINTTKNGITLKTNKTDNGKAGIYLSGKPTRSGTVTLTGTVDEGGNTDINYIITIEVAAKAAGSTEEDDADGEDGENEDTGKEETDDETTDDHVAPATTTKHDTGPDLRSIALVVVPILIVSLIVIFILLVHKRRKSRFVQMTVPSGPNSAFAEVASSDANPSIDAVVSTPSADIDASVTDVAAKAETFANSKTEDAAPASPETTAPTAEQKPAESQEPTENQVSTESQEPVDKQEPTDGQESTAAQQDSSEAELNQLEAEAQQKDK